MKKKLFVTLKSDLSRSFPNRFLKFLFCVTLTAMSCFIQNFEYLYVDDVYFIPLFLFSLYFSFHFYRNIFLKLLSVVFYEFYCFWLQFKMIEVIRYASCMQFYAFQISLIGLSCIHMYIVFCIFKLVSYFFSSLIIEVTNWSFCIHLCFRYFFLEFLIIYL